MTNLKTQYLGHTLRSPIVASASPLSQEVDNVRRMEDAGVSAVVMYSLFEEQLVQEQEELEHHLTWGVESFAEAITYFPTPDKLKMSSEHYLEQIHDLKKAVDVPIFASLNGTSLGGWTRFAQEIEEAGADALELNLYNIPTDINKSGAEVEAAYLEAITAVRNAVKIPISVKLSPFFSNMANMAKQIDDAGANGLVLFNRFYQPDINLETLEVEPNVKLSSSHEARLPMRWIAILYGKIKADLAATSGIHNGIDVIKMMMVGANVAMVASTTLRNGIEYIRTMEQEVVQWMEENEYDSIELMQGSMSQKNVADPSSFERAQYMKAVSSIPDNLLI